MKGYVVFSKGLAFTNCIVPLLFYKCNRKCKKKTCMKQVLTIIETDRDIYD